MTNNADYNRGTRDGRRFDLVRKFNNSWEAFLNGCQCHLIEPVTEEYLAGLSAAGCPVVRPNERRQSKIGELFDNLMQRVAFVMT